MKQKLEKQELHQIISRIYSNRDFALNQSMLGATSREDKLRIGFRAIFIPKISSTQKYL